MTRTASITFITCLFLTCCQQTKLTEQVPQNVMESDPTVSDQTVSDQINKPEIQPNQDATEEPLVPVTLDDFEITTLADSIEPQEIAQSVVVAIGITDKQIDAQKAKYGEEDFYVVADDNIYYNYMFEELLDSVAIKIVRPDSRFLKFMGTEKDYFLDLEKEGTDGLFWSYIMFNRLEPPQLIKNIIMEDASEISAYLERGEAALAATSEPVTCSYGGKPVSLGIGLVLPNSDEIRIFNDAELSDEYWKVNLAEMTAANQKCCPMYFKPDYGIMNFVCLEDLGNSFKILVNDSIVKYMPKDDSRELVSWEMYMKGAVGIKRSTHNVSIQPEQNPFRTEPNGNAEVINAPEGYYSICLQEIQGDWIKVEINCRELCLEEPQKNCENRTTAWIMWRSGEELLIDIALLV